MAKVKIECRCPRCFKLLKTRYDEHAFPGVVVAQAGFCSLCAPVLLRELTSAIEHVPFGLSPKDSLKQALDFWIKSLIPEPMQTAELKMSWEQE